MMVRREGEGSSGKTACRRAPHPSLHLAWQSTVVELRRGGPICVYTTGGSDFVLAISESVERLVAGDTGGAAPLASPVVEELDPATAASLTSVVITAMARQSLRTLGLAYRDFESVAALPDGWK